MKKFATILIASLITSVASAVVPASNTAIPVEQRPKIMWVDLSANWSKFTNPDTARYYVRKAADCGFNYLVVGVKGTFSAVAYRSDIAPRLTSWRGVTIPENFDYLDSMITIARENGMKILANLDQFCEGTDHYPYGLLQGDKYDWQATYYLPDTKDFTRVKNTEGPGVNFMNPARRDVQQYARSLLLEVARKYDVDGVMLDRCRYDGITSDFSDYTRSLFEKYIGKRVKKFPTDIISWKKAADGSYTRVEGKWFKKWLEFRAKVIYDYIAETRDSLKAVRPDIMVGVYTGAWYPSYFEVGVNWASSTFDASKHFDWATPNYMKYGYNELLDLYTNGNYYTCITLDELHATNGLVKNETDSQYYEGDHLCVEGACNYTRSLINGRPFYGGMYVEQYRYDAPLFARAVKMNLKKSDGFMLFDICHIIERGWWDVLKTAVTEAENELKSQQQ